MRRRYRRGKKGAGRGRKLNVRQKKEVKKLIAIRQELKYFQTAAAGQTVSTTPLVVDFSVIPQGDTDQEREGDRLMICGKMDFIYHIVVAGGATGDIYDTMRVIIFQWHPNSVPTSANVLINGPSGSIDVHSHYSHDFRQEYKILYDKIQIVVGNGISGTNPYAPNMLHVYKRHIGLKKATKALQFNGGATTGTNHIYLLVVSDSAAVTHPNITYNAKLFYRDS